MGKEPSLPVLMTKTKNRSLLDVADLAGCRKCLSDKAGLPHPSLTHADRAQMCLFLGSSMGFSRADRVVASLVATTSFCYVDWFCGNMLRHFLPASVCRGV